ncbi:MAG: ABC transporter ATP-binding protein [Chloroflexia bacterium]
MTETPVIETISLTKTYGSGEIAVHALLGIHLRIARGEFVAVVGPSGSGKSTLLNILGCLDRPTSGQYLLEGQDVSRLGRNELADIRNRKIGFIFQSYNLLPHLTALQNVALPLLYRRDGRLSDRERFQRAAEALRAVGLGDRLNHRPNQLSGGQQQRVAIARALVHRPAILLADEPTGNLDRRSGKEILELLASLNAQGMTLVLVTHDPEASAIARRVVLLRDGQIVSDQLNAGNGPWAYLRPLQGVQR